MRQYKSVPFEIKAVADHETGWEIAGLASTWWGEPDAYGDVVAPGAFAASLAIRATKFLYEHAEPIGKQLELRETDDGLFGRWSIVDTRAGADAYKLAKAGVLDALSIGYWPVEFEYRADGARVLQKIDLFEVSAVAVPANEHALISDVKAGSIYRAATDVLSHLDAWTRRALADPERKSDAGRAELRRVADLFGSHAERLLEASAPPASVTLADIEFDLIRQRRARAGLTEGERAAS